MRILRDVGLFNWEAWAGKYRILFGIEWPPRLAFVVSFHEFEIAPLLFYLRIERWWA